MDKETPSWLQSYQQPFAKKQNVWCESGHIHQQNMPAASFVFVRLNASMELDVLLDLRSKTIADGDIWGFIGGYANNIDEDELTVAYREALEEYGITRDKIKPLGLSYKRDHGGIKYLTYTYIFAEYNPRDGKAPAPLSHESVRSEWFSLEGGAPENLHKYIKEDRNMLDHVLREMVWPMLAIARDPDPAKDGVIMADINQVEHPADQDNAAQQQVSPPKKPAEPAARVKVPKTSPRAIARRGKGGNKSMSQRGKVLLGKKEGGAQRGEVQGDRTQPDKAKEEEKGKTASAKPDNELPSSLFSSWLNFFKPATKEPAVKTSPTPPPATSDEKQYEDKGKEPVLSPATAAEEPASPVPSSFFLSSSESEPSATPRTPAPRTAVPQPGRIPGGATPGTDSSPTPSSSPSPPAVAQPTIRPIANPFSPIQTPRTLGK
ncbi:hypothetical protein F5B17DRAFT_331528 [Nemania serpens]|nr:hypothetical protein F5B17DRAFT_331528 [Nemania serpens]